MKKYRSIIAILAAVVMVCSLIACTQKPHTESVTQAVTDENGEVVTGENGEIVTEEIEAQVVTDKNGAPVTEVVTDGEGKPVTTVKDGKYQNVTQVVTASKSGSATTKASANSKKKTTTTTKKAAKTTKAPVKKPTAPSAPSDLKGTAGENSVSLSWKGVKCSGYEVKAVDENSKTVSSFKTKEISAVVKNLASYTKYTFSVRAYNTNSAGTSVSKWVSKSVTTKESDKSHNITLNIKLPIDSNKEDILTIKIGDDKYTEKVNLNGSTYTFKSPKKYKGVVKITASLKSAGSSFSGKTDKETYSIDISGTGIDIVDGEDD